MNITTSANAGINGAQRFGGDMVTALEMIKLYRRVR
jgi:hypothetical protein